jgi:hypothetical protein
MASLTLANSFTPIPCPTMQNSLSATISLLSYTLSGIMPSHSLSA